MVLWELLKSGGKSTPNKSVDSRWDFRLLFETESTPAAGLSLTSFFLLPTPISGVAGPMQPSRASILKCASNARLQLKNTGSLLKKHSAPIWLQIALCFYQAQFQNGTSLSNVKAELWVFFSLLILEIFISLMCLTKRWRNNIETCSCC